MPAVILSKADARRLLANHHFRPTTAHGVFERLGSVQFDPLKPVGCNHDLVLQARVPGYRVDDWQRLAYEERFIYDGWDKQASLVRMADWPYRRVYHRWHERWWRKKVLNAYPQAVNAVLAELKRRGPLTSTAFEHQVHMKQWQGSWYGPKLTKNVLRALWHTGKVLTHSRKHGHHVYDLAERVVPGKLLRAKPVSEQASVEFLIECRHQAMGLLRPTASAEVWSMDASLRKAAIASLVARKKLVQVEVDGMRFHAVPSALERLDEPLDSRMVFVAPLDQMIWDRKAVHHLFGFEYRWEVYVPQPKRRWGYYVLPVFCDDRFVGRVESKRVNDIWQVVSWRWEQSPTPAQLLLLEPAAARFRDYLQASALKLPRGLDAKTKAALKAGFAE
jgi:uncharacterized protein